MLDPSLRRWCERVRRPRGIAVAMPETFVDERMDHPAARILACQTSVRSACPYTKLLTIAVSPGSFRVRRRSRVHTGPMKDAGELGGPSGPLPPALAGALAAFERHLRYERSLSPHTVRAYASDISSLLEHASRQGV